MTEQTRSFTDILKTTNESQMGFYGRCSTKKQNINSQRSLVSEFLSQHGKSFEKIRKFEDKNTSTRKYDVLNRPGVIELLNAAKSKKLRVLIIYDKDRVARDTIQHFEFLEQMTQLNVDVLTIKGEKYTEGEIITQAATFGITQMEREFIRERTRDTLRSKKTRGEWVGGKAPFGYKYVKGSKNQFKEIKSQTEIVKEIFRLFNLGYGFQDISNYVANCSSYKINKNRVKYIISNPFYAGYIANDKTEIGKDYIKIENLKLTKVDGLEGVISQEEWIESYSLLLHRSSTENNRKRTNTPFLLNGILFCKICLNKLKTKNNKKNGNGKSYYKCETSGCNYRIEITTVHNEVFSLIEQNKRKLSKEKINQGIASKVNEEIQSLTRSRTLIDEEITALKIKVQEAYSKLEAMTPDHPLKKSEYLLDDSTTTSSESTDSTEVKNVEDNEVKKVEDKEEIQDKEKKTPKRKKQKNISYNFKKSIELKAYEAVTLYYLIQKEKIDKLNSQKIELEKKINNRDFIFLNKKETGIDTKNITEAPDFQKRILIINLFHKLFVDPSGNIDYEIYQVPEGC
jgi:DNA invertase Pin-like site-specific DNA recombinase